VGLCATTSTGECCLLPRMHNIYSSSLCARRGGKKTGVHVQPFNSLGLDIAVRHASQPACVSLPPAHRLVGCVMPCVSQHPSVVDLDSALSMTFSPHDVSGAAAASTSRGVTQRLAVEGLPPVLVLQLKRFTIAGTGGQRKVAKHIAYDQRLTFPRQCCAAMLHAQPNQYCKLLCMACTCIGRTADSLWFVVVIVFSLDQLRITCVLWLCITAHPSLADTTPAT